MTQAVIFDMDGMLLDSERLSVLHWKKAGLENGLLLSDSLLASCIGLSNAATRNWLETKLTVGDLIPPIERGWIKRLDRAEERYLALHDAMDPANERPPVKAGVFELLFALGERSVPVAVATSTGTAKMRDLLTESGIAGYCALLLSGDQVSRNKPAPDIYIEAARRLGVPAESCIVFEDSAPGITAASRAGCRVAHVQDLAVVPEEILGLCRHRYGGLGDALGKIGEWL